LSSCAGRARDPAHHWRQSDDAREGRTITIVGQNIRINASESVRISDADEPKIGVGSQNTFYNTEKVATSGAAISAVQTANDAIRLAMSALIDEHPRMPNLGAVMAATPAAL